MKLSTGLLSIAALTASACLLPEEREAENESQSTGVRPSRSRWFPAHSKRQSSSFPIGEDDRFEDGTLPPVGLGLNNDERKDSILNPAEIESGLRGLKAAYPDFVELFTPPFETYEGSRLPGAVIGSDDEPRVFLMSGIHARERGGPDHTLYFIGDLLAAHANGTGLTYGRKRYSAEDVKTALSAGAVILPLTNPDGVAYDQSTGSCWRKNRNLGGSGTGGGPVGVDLNRNFDFVFDYKTAFNTDADISSAASDDPGSEIYHGTSAFSEPETQAVRWAVRRWNRSLSWFLDLHSYGGDVLYAWGDDDAGTERPDMNFANREFDGARGFTGRDPPDSRYREFISTEDLSTEVTVTLRMAAAMKRAEGIRYQTSPSVDLYPTSGGSNDWVMGRYYGKTECGAGRVLGLCVEFGAASAADWSCPFYPDGDEYHQSMRQVAAGLMELMLAAAGRKGKTRFWECDG